MLDLYRRTSDESFVQGSSVEALSARFLVPENVDFNSGKVACGIAEDERAKYNRRIVATQRYLAEGYITRDDLGLDGTYYDKYESCSIPLVAKVDGKVVASMRLIQNIPVLGLPTNDDTEIKIFDAWKVRSASVWFEVSQLAKDPSFRSHNPTLGLIRSFIVIALQQQKYESVAVIDEAVRKMLNGPFMGFGLPEIGPTVRYMGSDSTPVFIDVRDLTANSRRNGHENLADFLEGKTNVQGYEWYVGP